MSHRLLFCLVLVLTIIVVLAGTAAAARVRFHYGPPDASGYVCLQPAAVAAEQRAWLGAAGQPVAAPRPTRWLAFRHPCTGCPVTVPVALPQGTPVIEYRTGRVVYNYGSYTVAIQFLADGSVDVIYDSGLFRPL
jgi:hypothetical protein